MLKELYIENLAVIEKCSVNFCAGFNVFTGETGAGKSVLIGGIKAILGGRVSKDTVRSGAEKAEVCAVFAGKDEDLILTREIYADGRSSARINGRPATASMLRETASELIDIHGQHDSRTLTDNEQQRILLDNFAGLEGDLEVYVLAFREFSALSKKLKRLQEDESNKNERAEFLRGKLDDVNRYKLTIGEEAETASRLTALRNSEAINKGLQSARECLSGDSNEGAADLIRQCRAALREIAGFLPSSSELLSRLKSAEIELDDIRGELAALDCGGFDTEQTLKLEERMSDLLHLRRKYKLETDELIAVSEQWRNELAELEYSEDMTHKLITERKAAGDNLKRLAEEITQKRKTAATRLAQAVAAELRFLDMPDVNIFFDVRQENVTVTGMDAVEIMISVNPGEEPKPLARIASGGELSRIMLALKSVLADSVPTMIFDEIDTGISGRAAQKVGAKMAAIAEKRQVLCVTHLAAIAAKADKHLLIEKYSHDDRTFTRVEELDYEARKKEITRIISGDEDELVITSPL